MAKKESAIGVMQKAQLSGRKKKAKRSNPSIKFSNRSIDKPNASADAELAAQVIRVVKSFPKKKGTIRAKSSTGKTYTYTGDVIANAGQQRDARAALKAVAQMRRGKTAASVEAGRRDAKAFVQKYK